MAKKTGIHSGGAVLTPMGSFTPLRFEIPAPTVTIAENRIDLPVIGGRVVYEIWRIIHSHEENPIISEPGAAAVVDEFDVARVRYALSLEQGLATIPTGYGRSSTMYYQNTDLKFFKSAAGSLACVEKSVGMPEIYLPQPPIVVADARLSFYAILEDPDSLVGIVGKVSLLELLVRVRSATGDEILDLARAGGGWI